MTSLPLTKKNLKQFMNAYANKMESKQQRAPSEVSFASTKRSKSSTRSRSKPKNGKRSRSLRGPRAHALKAKAVKMLSPLAKTLETSTKRLALAKSGYFTDSKDVKADIPSLQKDVDQLMKEIQLAVGALRAGLGDRPIKMRLSAPFVITTTVTTGVTNTVTVNGQNNNLNASYCSEWATCALLFEEYKCLGGEAVFNYINPQSNFTNANILTNSIPTIAYDADDATLATSVISLTQAAQHRCFDVTVGSTATQGPSSVPASCITHRFKWHVPKGDSVSGTGVTVAGTEWIAVAAPPPSGYLKFYHVGLGVTANDTGAGFIYFNLEFRCRS